MKQGIIMEIQSQDAYVFTNECSLIKVPVRKDMFVGQSISWQESAQLPASKKRWLVPALSAACLVLLLLTGLLLYGLFLPQAGTVYLSLDINPSVEFTLDANRTVTEVTPLNNDAWELMAKTSLKGLKYSEAITRWIALVHENNSSQLQDLLITAVLTDRDNRFADEIMALDSSQNGIKPDNLAGMNIKVLFTTDAAVKKDADSNGLSVGRQMLLNKSRALELDFDVRSIQIAPIHTLLQCLNLNQVPTQTLSLQTTQTLPLETKPAESTAAPSETKAETLAPTTVKPTTKATTKATTAAPAGPILKAANSTEGWKLSWTVSSSGKTLAYYKVVISKADSTPRYPDNGYLYAISERSNTQCLVNNSSGYNGGDFDGYLTVGQKYFVSITYVYKDGSKEYSSVLQLTYSGPGFVKPTTAATAAFKPVLTGESDTAGFHLSWTKSPADRSLAYYKVVISKSDSTPQYPDNGYLYALSDSSETTCLASNTRSYNGGDIGGYLVAGQKYFVGITYVYKDGSKEYSNVLQLTYNGPGG